MEPDDSHPLMLSARTAILLPLVLAGLLAGAVCFCQPEGDLPEGWRSVTISACEDAAEFGAGRAPDRAQFDFDAWEAEPTAGARVRGQSLRWHVKPSSDRQIRATLMWSGALSAPCDRIALWLKNPNGHQLTLRLELTDLDCVRYTSAAVDLAGEPGWRQIVFPVTEFTPVEGQRDPFPGVDLPAIGLSVIIEPLAAGKPYTLYIDEITAVAAPMPTAEVVGLQAPTSLGPAERIPVRARLLLPEDPPSTACVRAWLESTDGGQLAGARMELSEADAQGVRLATSPGLRVPRWLPPGAYRLRLSATGLMLTGAEPLRVAVAGVPPATGDAQIDTATRPPRIAFRGAMLTPVVRELRGDAPSTLPADAELVAVATTTGGHPFCWAADVDGEDGALDFSALDRRIGAVLEAAPRAAIILQTHLASTAGWNAAHPEDLQHFDGDTIAPPQIFGRSRVVADVISPAWQAEALARLRALAEHVQRAPWRHRVIGWELQAGDLGTWRPVGASLGLGDEATPLRESAFRAWLMRHYPDVTAFRDAWLNQRRGITGVPQMTPVGFEAVRLPRPATDRPEPSLYDPAIDRPMIDLAHFRAEAPVDLLLAAADVVREVSGAGTLVGACYGHMLAQSAEDAWRWPHLAMTRVLADERIDFLTGAPWTAAAPPVPSLLADAARNAGKLALERLTPTHLRRNAASALISGAGLTGDAATLAELGEAELIVADHGGEAQTPAIFVVDDISARYLSPEGGLAAALLARQLHLWARSGIAYEVHTLPDVLDGRAPRARMYFFADLMTIAPKDGNRLGATVARDGAMLVWVYGAGSVAENLITGRTMKYLTGIKLSLLPARGPLRTRIDAAAALPGSGLQGTVVYGLPAGSPRFFSADESVEWLGTLAGIDPDADLQFCGLALKRFADCTSVFSAAPMLPSGLIRGLAARAEITPNADAAAGAWFGPGVMAVEGADSPRVITLSGAARVTDLSTGEVVAEGRSSVTLSMSPGEIGLFAIEPP